MSLQWTASTVEAVRMKIIMISLFLKKISDKVVIITTVWLNIFKLDNEHKL